MKTSKIFLAILATLFVAHANIASAYRYGLDFSSSNSYIGGGSDNAIFTIISLILFYYITPFVLLPWFIRYIKRVTGGASNILLENSLVLRKYSVGTENEPALYLEARKGGIWSFIMTKLRIQNKVMMIVNATERTLVVETHNIDGHNRTSLLLEDIDFLSFGYARAVKSTVFLSFVLLIITFVSAPSAGLGALVIFLLGGAYIGLRYFFSHKFALIVNTNSGNKIELNFSTSMIENISMNEKKAREIQSIIFDIKKAR